MTVDPTGMLLATASFPTLGALGALLVISLGANGSDSKATAQISVEETLTLRFPHRRWGFALAQVGFLGGIICGAILAYLLARVTEPASSVLRLPLWTWFALSVPQTPSIAFGLEATWIKAGLVSFTGALAMIGVWNASYSVKKQLSEDALLATSLLYAAGTIFILAPNTAQALLGWAAVSVLVVVLMRQSHPKRKTLPGNCENRPARMSRPQSNEIAEGNLLRRLQPFGKLAVFLGRIFDLFVWQTVTRIWPNWFAEQAEIVEESTVLFRRMATILWASAILLTWILYA